MPTKLISYSLYGTDPLYLSGALRNAQLAPIIYPGWTPRFYVSQEISASLIQELHDAGAEVVRMERHGLIDGMSWRFLPAADPRLDAVLFRDVDSRPTAREAAAVMQWLESGKAIHIMRDHPCHRVVIMAGMWGCRGGAVPDMALLIERWNLWKRKGHDQDFLRDAIYPRFKQSLLVHSEIYAHSDEECLPFPFPRQNGEFVGSVIDPDRDTLTDEQAAENEALFRRVVLERLPPARCRKKWVLRAEQWVRDWTRRAG